MSDLFGGQDPAPAWVQLTCTPGPAGEGYTLALVVAESTSRRQHREVVEQVPAELLADVLEASAWWIHLAMVSTQGQHKGVPKKWGRRTAGRIAGWRSRAR